MSGASGCCICLDEFSCPASLPCGHRFCLGCIGEFWRIQEAYRCPLCQASYPSRPRLQTDPGLRVLREEPASALRRGEVPCDLCPVQSRAVRSCLQCLTSYCAAHLEPHYQEEELGRHLLLSVVKNLEDFVCKIHGKQLSRFCRSDRTFICVTCAQTEHRGHHIVSINKEATKKKVRIKRRKIKLLQAIQEKISTIEKMKLCAEENPREACEENKELIEKLQEEISDLQRRSKDLESLSLTEDNLHFLQLCLKLQTL